MTRMSSPCLCCKNEPEPGYIELPNNGPVVPCWVCNFEEWRRSCDRRSPAIRPQSLAREAYESAWRIKESLR
jgi:hypothetical protein